VKIRLLVTLAALALSTACTEKGTPATPGSTPDKPKAAAPTTKTYKMEKLGLSFQMPVEVEVGESMELMDSVTFPCCGGGAIQVNPVKADSMVAAKNLEEAKKSVNDFQSPKLTKAEATTDGWRVEYDHDSGMGRTFKVTIRRTIDNKAFDCETTGGEAAKAQLAAKACETLAPIGGAAKPAAAPGADNAAGPAAKIVGTWRQEKEFGESKPKAEAARPVLTIRADSLSYLFPASGVSPITGKPDKETKMEMKYKVAESKGNVVLVKTTLSMEGAGEMPGDDKRFTLVDDHTLEEKGVADGKETGLGGVWKRFDAAAAPAAPAAPATAAPTPAPAAAGGSDLCAKAAKCCHYVSGKDSPACDSLLKAPDLTCKNSLQGFKKAVKAVAPKHAAECQ
jgi:hypothetical protein